MDGRDRLWARRCRRACAALAFIAVGTSPAQAATLTVQEGAIAGTQRNGVSRYLGIPYARPPVGDLRWAPPQGPLAWEGVRPATAFAAACAQIGNYFTSNDPQTFDRPYGSEDCLYLNVWAPTAQQRAPRPVIVFIHGGSGVVGAASLPLYDGQRLAQELDAVIISINYRLSFFGNFHLAALKSGDPARDSGNFALLDKIKALEWVQRNAARFGGNPANVTVMGHSAGCVSIWALLRSPLAKGTFDKVICLSGIPLQSTEEEALENSRQYLGEVLYADGMVESPDDAEGWLKSKTPEQVRDYLYGKSTVELSQIFKDVRPVPEVADGYVLATDVEARPVNAVPAILGNTAKEAPFLILAKFSPLDYSGMWSLIQGEQKSLSLSDFFKGPFARFEYKLSGWYFNRKLLKKVDESASLLASASVPVYRYEFRWDHIPEPWKTLYGSYHGLDVPFVFGNFDKDSPNFTSFTWADSDDAETESLHQVFVTALRGFIASGDPNHFSPAEPWPEWGSTENSIRIP